MGHDPKALFDPAYNLQASKAEIMAAYQQGKAQGLSGRDLTMFVARVAQRPAAEGIPQYGLAYDQIAGGQGPAPSGVSSSAPAEPPYPVPQRGEAPLSPLAELAATQQPGITSPQPADVAPLGQSSFEQALNATSIPFRTVEAALTANEFEGGLGEALTGRVFSYSEKH